MTDRFFLDQDDSCHWYVVRESRATEWQAWLDLDPYESVSGYPPAGVAYAVGGWPGNIRFTDPVWDGSRESVLDD